MPEIIALYAPKLGGGGAERVMLNLACGFVDRGYSVDMVLSAAEGQYLSELDSRVNLIDLRVGRVAASIPGLIRYLRSRKPSVIIATQLHANIAALIAVIISGSKSRIVVRETNSPVGQSIRRESIWMRFLNSLGRLFYRRAESVVVGSTDQRHQIAIARSVPLEKVSVIHNPIRIEEIRALAAIPTEHPWFGSGQGPVVLSVGRLVEQKDYETLILAIAKVRRSIKTRLVILGEGPLRKKLTSLAESLHIGEFVDLFGFVENPYQFMARADAFVLSSLWEGLPNVLLEAMTLGTPIVATDCQTGPREILRDGKDGILVPIRDADAMAQAIQTSLESDSRKTLASESLNRFEFHNVIDQYLAVLLPGSKL